PNPVASASATTACIDRLICQSCVRSPAHEFFGSRKLRLAPQDYSPWTPPSDRFLVRSYPPASRHPAPQPGRPFISSGCGLKYSVPQVSGPTQAECHPELAKDPRPKRSTRRVADPSTSLAGSLRSG